MSPKLLLCIFLDNIFCSFVNREGLTGVMARCTRCSHYLRFMAELEAEEDAFWEEEERLRREKSLG